MYAIVEDGGKQYRLQTGDTVLIEQREATPDADRVDFDRVLMIGDGKNSKIGTPWIEGAKVVGRLDEALKGRKIDIMKFKRRKGYKLRKGHRQRYWKVTIESIDG